MWREFRSSLTDCDLEYLVVREAVGREPDVDAVAVVPVTCRKSRARGESRKRRHAINTGEGFSPGADQGGRAQRVVRRWFDPEQRAIRIGAKTLFEL